MVRGIDKGPISAAKAKRSGPLPDIYWVYVICWRQRGPCKIGFATLPHERRAGLQTGSPYKLHVWRAFGTKDSGVAFRVEALALARLGGVRLQGEWVNATVNQASDAVIAAFTKTCSEAPVVYDKDKHKQKAAIARGQPPVQRPWQDAALDYWSSKERKPTMIRPATAAQINYIRALRKKAGKEPFSHEVESRISVSGAARMIEGYLERACATAHAMS